MKDNGHFIGFNDEGRVVFVCEVSDTSFNVISSEIGEVNSLDAVMRHPSVNRLEKAHSANESVSVQAYVDVDGVRMTRTEFLIFDTLRKKLGRVVPKEVLQIVLKNFAGEEQVKMRLQISRLRKKIKNLGYIISNIYSTGYILTKPKAEKD